MRDRQLNNTIVSRGHGCRATGWEVGQNTMTDFAQLRRSTLRAERSVAVGRHYELGPAGAKRPDVGREDPEAAAAATVFFDDGSVHGALRIPAPIPVL
jgi:hypothetical protein